MIRLHLIPTSLKKKIAMREALEKGHAAAVEKAHAAGETPPEPLPPFVLTEADYAGFSGRVVLLRGPLSLSECDAAEAFARGRVGPDSTFLDFDLNRKLARVQKMIVGVSDPHTDPRQAMTATIRKVTEADLEGVSMVPGENGQGRGNGLSFAELFSYKDKIVLNAQDQRWHAVPDTDLEAILGNAIPTAD